MTPTREEMETLESLMNRVGFRSVMEALATICSEKAEHLRTNWSDHRQSKAWERASAAASAAARKTPAQIDW